jgi:hypothetical protein
MGKQFIERQKNRRERLRKELSNEDYSWKDLAVVLHELYPNDMDELIYMINEQKNK